MGKRNITGGKMKIEIVEFETEKVIKTFDVTGKSERQIEKIENGININLDLERFYSRVV
jgi:hypothetical protein